jgi:tetratricopeptide (TPR) repeat protein
VALHHLVERQLVQNAGYGAITLHAAYRRALYESMPPEVREQLHADAALVRTAHGEFTAAAYHHAQAGQAAQAVRLWYAYRYGEIDQGQAGAALHVFSQISQNQLDDAADRELLGLIRGELHKVLGNYLQAQETLRAITWRTPRLAAVAGRLAGDIAELSGEVETAQAAYQEGMRRIDNLLETELALFHRDQGWIFRRQKRLDQAWREVQSAQYELENLQGHLHHDRRDFAQAEEHYGRALTLAQALQYADGEAKSRNALAAVLIKQDRFAEAEAHFEQAHQVFQRIGKLLSVGSVRVNQAVACLLDQRPAQAIVYAEQARVLFEQLAHPYGMATAYQALAEAHLAQGALAQAERYGWQALETEEGAVVPDALRVIGEIALERGDYAQAEQYIGQALAAARDNEDRYLEAYALRALGRLYLRRGSRQAVRWLQTAAAVFEQIGLGAEAERTRALVS